MTERQIWVMWWAGSILIVLSWIHVVPARVGWIGFGVACLSSLISVVQARYWKVPSKSAPRPGPSAAVPVPPADEKAPD